MAGRDRSWALATGALVGGVSAAGLLYLKRRWFGRPEEVDRVRQLADLEERVVDALDAEPMLDDAPIEVCALADGIVELTGSVGREEEATRAVEVTRDIAGVRTVLNRLDIAETEAHLKQTRERYAAGEPSLNEAHWYGMGVGTGRRRQGQTDPQRRDDRVDMVTRTIDERELDGDATPPQVSGADGAAEPHVEVQPGVELAIEEAGLERNNGT